MRKFTIEKSHLIVLKLSTIMNRTINTFFHLLLANEHIDSVNEYLFFELLINNTLSWSSYVQNVCKCVILN